MATKVYIAVSIAAVFITLTTDNWILFVSLLSLGCVVVLACLYSGFNVGNLKRAAIVLGIILAVVTIRAVVPVHEVYRTSRGQEVITRSFLTGKLISVRKIRD